MTALITLDGLSKAVPTAHITDLAKYVDPLDEALRRYTIDTPRRIAAFIAQVAHEHGLNALADVGDEASFNQITLRINGGWNGKEDRLQNWAEAKTILLA